MQRPVMHSVSVSHHYGSALGEVFDAWLRPEAVSQWLRMGAGSRPSAVSIDRRVGGQFEILLRDQDSEVPLRGSYLEIDRPSRLMFTWISPGTEQRESIVTIDLQPELEGTRLMLAHDGLSSAQRAQEHAQGWTEVLRHLERQLA